MRDVDSAPVALTDPLSQEILDRLSAIGKGGRTGGLVSAVAILAVAIALILLVVLINREQSRVAALNHAYAELKRANDKIAALTEDARRANDRAAAFLRGQPAQNPAVKAALSEISNADQSLNVAATVQPSNTIPAAAKETRPAASAPVRREQVLARGITSGWDVDIFWCPNGAANANYAEAAGVANRLATAASNESDIGPGMRLGRVRLRPATPILQQDWEGENGVVFDNGDGDQAAATMLLSYIGGPSAGFRLFHSVGRPTPYYLSIKLCRVAR